MDDFSMLARDFGFRPQGKSAPMKSDGSRPPSSSATVAEENQIFSDVFGGPAKHSNNHSKSTSVMADFDYDAIFINSASTNNDEAKSKATSMNLPVYDKPVYDDDIFDGLPGLKSKSMSSSASQRLEENIFASMSSSPPKRSEQSDHFDDLLGISSRTQKVEPTQHNHNKSPGAFDDLIPGFGSGNPASNNRSSLGPTTKPTANTDETSYAMDNPFAVLESMSTTANSNQSLPSDPLEEIGHFSKSGTLRPSVSGVLFDDIDPLNGFGKSAPASSSEINNKGEDQSPPKEGSGTDRAQSSISKDSTQKASFRYSESHLQEVPVDDFHESQHTVSDVPAVSRNHHTSCDQSTSPPPLSPKLQHVKQADEIWLTVSEIPLFTQPTRAPPPSRPPPPIPRCISKSEKGLSGSNSRKVRNGLSSPNSPNNAQSSRPFEPVAKSPLSSPLDDHENLATVRVPNNIDNHADPKSAEGMDSTLAAAAMKEAMDRAEAKFRHAKEVREREYAKAFRNKESIQPDRDEQQDRRDREHQEREEEEREQRRLEKERMREVERQKARQAVERATREARERAAFEARERASAEARLKAERAAVQRAQAEARERAAVGARERAEKAAAEARDKAQAAFARAEEDTRRRTERAAVERVAAEARKRAAAEAHERAAALRMNQQRNDNDLESFFSTGTRPSSAPRPRAMSSDSASDPLSQNRQGPEGAHRTSTTGVSSNMRKASSTTNIVDDLSSIFGAAPTSAQFQEVEGETEERRRARLEREQRTQERAAKALAEKNQRDRQSQREQEERHRIGGTLDTEIKRWAAGKEGNLRALLSTLQYVLWPECGWQPVSLTDLITGANVKKAYRKATLCIHPDKVQQKGANLQQKYVAEKVFDILKEAWNKFNSEELF